MKSNFKLIIVVIIFVIIAGIFYKFYPDYRQSVSILESHTELAEVKINEKVFNVFVADSEEERRRGLIGHKSLSKNSGMLFIFDAPSMPRFWMKDMQFPIDIIWIYQNQIIGWSENALPQPSALNDELIIYYPPSLVDMVLEVASGTARENNIRIGDIVTVNHKQ